MSQPLQSQNLPRSKQSSISRQDTAVGQLEKKLFHKQIKRLISFWTIQIIEKLAFYILILSSLQVLAKIIIGITYSIFSLVGIFVALLFTSSSSFSNKTAYSNYSDLTKNKVNARKTSGLSGQLCGVCGYKVSQEYVHCSYCKICVNKPLFHSTILNSCIKENRKSIYSVIALSCLISSFLYLVSSIITLIMLIKDSDEFISGAITGICTLNKTALLIIISGFFILDILNFVVLFIFQKQIFYYDQMSKSKKLITIPNQLETIVENPQDTKKEPEEIKTPVNPQPQEKQNEIAQNPGQVQTIEDLKNQYKQKKFEISWKITPEEEKPDNDIHLRGSIFQHITKRTEKKFSSLIQYASSGNSSTQSQSACINKKTNKKNNYHHMSSMNLPSVQRQFHSFSPKLQKPRPIDQLLDHNLSEQNQAPRQKRSINLHQSFQSQEQAEKKHSEMHHSGQVNERHANNNPESVAVNILQQDLPSLNDQENSEEISEKQCDEYANQAKINAIRLDFQENYPIKVKLK